MSVRNVKGGRHPILHFIETHHLEKTGDFSILKEISPFDRRVGLVIDGVKLQQDMENEIRKEEPLCGLSSCVPFTGYRLIAEIAALFNDVAINVEKRNRALKAGSNGANATKAPSSPGGTPNMGSKKIMVVFNGCLLKPVVRDLFVSLPEEILSLNILNESSAKTIKEETVRDFSMRFYLEEDVEGYVIRSLKKYVAVENAVEIMRAPYLAWAQISAFFSPSNLMASEVFGSIELLAFPGIERVITSFLPDGKLKYVSKSDLLDALCTKFNKKIDEKTLSQFLLMCSSHREFRDDLVHDGLLDLIFSLSSDNQVEHFANTSMKAPSKELFLRNTSALESPVMTKTGTVRPLRELYDKKPSFVLLKYYGRPLPDRMYYCLCSGILNPAPFASLSHFVISDTFPTIDTPHFRDRTTYVLSLRAQMLHFLNLQEFQSEGRRLQWHQPYYRKQPFQPVSIPSRTVLCQWKVPELLEGEKVYFSSVLQYAKLSELDRNVTHVAQTKSTTLAAIHLLAIDLLGYVSHLPSVGSNLSHFGEALSLFACDTLSPYGLLFIEMIRTRILSDSPIIKRSAPEERPKIYPKGVLFAARTLSIIHINSMGTWTGPVDIEIAAFGTCSRMLSKALRSLMELVACNFFLERFTSLPLTAFPEVVMELPFDNCTEFNAGLLILYMLMTPTCTLESLKETFPQLYTLDTDLATLRYFWNRAYEAYPHMTLDTDEKEQVVGFRDCIVAANTALTEAFYRVLGPEIVYNERATASSMPT